MMSKLRLAFKNIKIIVVTEVLLMIAMVTTIVVKAGSINELLSDRPLARISVKTVSTRQSDVATYARSNIDAVEAEKAAKAADDKRNEIIAYARQFIGRPYVLGGQSLTKGSDCASFITLIYSNFGYNWPMGSVSTLYDNCGGREVSADDMKPGDIIFFGRGGKKLHVAIYAGDGRIIHAMDRAHGVCEINLYRPGTKLTYSGRSILSIRRIIG